jgi:hypothetical protein
LGAALALSAPAYADFRTAYVDGLEAADDGDWAKVRAKMSEALAENPTPAAKIKLYGMRFGDYVPQYYLGLAAYRTGDCRAAVQNWDHGPTRAILKGNSALAGVAEAGMRDCMARLAQVTPSPSPSPTARPSPTPSPTPVVSPTPRPSPSPTPTARPSPTPSPSPSPTAAPSPAPRALADAVDAYLAGRYDALVSFNVDQFSEPRARWHALILRAAARHTRASLQGDAGAPLLVQAQADIRAAKAILSPQSPDPQLFSPRFRQLFASTR